MLVMLGAGDGEVETHEIPVSAGGVVSTTKGTHAEVGEYDDPLKASIFHSYATPSVRSAEGTWKATSVPGAIGDVKCE